MITCDKNDLFTSTLLATPPRYIDDASICLVNAKFIYLTGGFNGRVVVANCHRYDIERNLWQMMAK